MTEPVAFDHEALLRRRVTLMRELGVTKWNGIELGPAPAAPAPRAAPRTPEERRAEELAELRQEYRDKIGDYTSPDDAIDALIPPDMLERLKS